MRAIIVSELHLCLQTTGGSRVLLLALAPFTQLRRLSLELQQRDEREHEPSAADLLSLRALHSLRELRLGTYETSWMALTNEVLLALLQCMSMMRVLSVDVRTGLSSSVLPAIGALCRALEQLNFLLRCIPTALTITPGRLRLYQT
jgi:hypothetical protein